MAHAQRVVFQKTDFRGHLVSPSNHIVALKPFNKNDINNSGANKRPDPLLARYNSRDSPTKRLKIESSGPIEIKVPSSTQRALVFDNTNDINITSASPSQLKDQTRFTYSTPTKLFASDSKYDQTSKRPRDEQQSGIDQPPSKIQRTNFNHVTHSTIGPVIVSPPMNNTASSNTSTNVTPLTQLSPVTVAPSISPANVNYNRSYSQPVFSPVNKLVESSCSANTTDVQLYTEPEPRSFSQPSPVTRSGSASGSSFIVSSQPSTQGYTPNTTPYSSQCSQATVSVTHGLSSQPNVDDVQSLKIEISKVYRQ